jgi:outer membrane biosynthesis protein TonB
VPQPPVTSAPPVVAQPSPAANNPVPPPQNVTTPVPAPSATAAGPTNVAVTALDGNRSAGNKEIAPDGATRTEMSRAGVEKVTGRFKLCVTAEGTIGSVTLMKSTGFPNYDDRIQSTIRNQWRFKPFVISGKSTAVCSVVSFLYTQS